MAEEKRGLKKEGDLILQDTSFKVLCPSKPSDETGSSGGFLVMEELCLLRGQ